MKGLLRADADAPLVAADAGATVIAMELLTAGEGRSGGVAETGVDEESGGFGAPLWVWSDAVNVVDGRFISRRVDECRSRLNQSDAYPHGAPQSALRKYDQTSRSVFWISLYLPMSLQR